MPQAEPGNYRVHGQWRLTFRLLRGAGARDRVRLGLQVLAIAMATVCGLLAVTLPMVFAAQTQRVANRYPAWDQAVDSSGGSSSSLVVGISSELYHDQTLSVWLVSATSTNKVIPPGIPAVPAPGHLWLSPALATARAHDPALRARLPGIVDGTITASGLASPSELFAWVGVTGADGLPVASFGVSTDAVQGVAPSGGPSPTIELIVLVGLPLLGFLVAAARMSGGSRTNRLKTLHLLGLPIRACQTLNGRVLGMTAGVGAVVGCLLLAPVSAWLGSTGMLGVSWFAPDTHLPAIILLGVVLLVAWFGRQVGRSSVGHTLRSVSMIRPARKWPTWLLVCFLVVGVTSIGFLGYTWFSLPTVGDPANLRWQLWVMIAWLVLVGLSVAMAYQLSGRITSVWSRRGHPSATTNLGLRLTRAKPAGSVLAIGLVGMMIVIAGASTVYTQAVVAVSSGRGEPMQVAILPNHLESTQQQQLVHLLDDAEYSGTASVTGSLADATNPNNSDVFIVVASCSSMEKANQTTLDCGSGPVLLTNSGTPRTVNPGDMVTIPMTTGGDVAIQVPTRTGQSGAPGYGNTILVPPRDAPWLADAKGVQFSYLVTPNGQAGDKLMAAIASKAPSATVSMLAGDDQSRVQWQQQQQLLRAFTWVGFIFCVLSLLLLGFGMSQDQLRSVTALQLLGIARRRLSLAVAFSKALPVAVALLIMVIATGLGGQALMAVFGFGGAMVPLLWAQALISAVIGVGLSALLGAFIVGRLDMSQPDARE